MGPGGALEAAIEAREQGLARFIGVTGHELTVAEMHLRSLARFDFDSVLLPYNYPIMQQPALCGRLRGAGDAVPGAQRRGADDQGDPAPALGRPATDVAARGTSRWRSRPTSIWRWVTCLAAPASS